MESLLAVVGLALLPALGNIIGGLLAEFLPTPKRVLNKALHAASGIILAVVAIELMPEALQKISGWAIAVAFGMGGGLYVAIELIIDRLQSRGGSGSKGSSERGMWMIFVAVSMDLFSDGLLIGASSSVSLSMALVLALGQVLADVPEGYAAIANMKESGLTRRRRLFLSASLVIPVLFAALVAYFLLRDADDLYKIGALVLTAGLLTVAAVEDMISEAHESAEDSKWSALSFVGGFVLFTLVSAGLGS